MLRILEEPGQMTTETPIVEPLELPNHVNAWPFAILSGPLRSVAAELNHGATCQATRLLAARLLTEAGVKDRLHTTLSLADSEAVKMRSLGVTDCEGDPRLLTDETTWLETKVFGPLVIRHTKAIIDYNPQGNIEGNNGEQFLGELTDIKRSAFSLNRGNEYISFELCSSELSFPSGYELRASLAMISRYIENTKIQPRYLAGLTDATTGEWLISTIGGFSLTYPDIDLLPDSVGVDLKRLYDCLPQTTGQEGVRETLGNTATVGARLTTRNSNQSLGISEPVNNLLG